MTVKELTDQLKLVKNKDTEVVFKNGSDIYSVDFMAEVIKTEEGGVRYPKLGEQTNAIVMVMKNVE
jgi:hypothetical protein